MRNKIVRYANECVGKSRSEVGCAGTHAWCAHFVSNVLEHVGIKDVSSTFCTYLRNNLLESGKFEEPEDYPIPGDIIFFDWDHIKEDRPLDHVAICVAFDENTKQITYVNGNGSSSSYVTKQYISVNNTSVEYWTRYVGDSAKAETKEEPAAETSGNVSLPTLKSGSKGGYVKSLQILLTCKYGYTLPKYGCDSDFGAETLSALKGAQKDFGIFVDGVCGPETWSKLLSN